MSQNIIIIAFGTFGNPNGFKQTFFELSDKNIARGIKTFDLNTNAIKIFPSSKVYSIRKEVVNGINAISYTIYTFAKEQNSDRGGTFIGSSILYLDKISEEIITINCLNEFHNYLVSKNVQNDIIVVNHSDNFSVAKPNDFDKLSYQAKDVEDLNFIQTSNKSLVVYCNISPDKIKQLFKKSIDLLNVYDTIYFTDSEEVATFVNQKKIFKLANDEKFFDKEILNIQLERIQKTQYSIGEFQSEKQKLEIDRNKVIENYKFQLEQNERTHKENNEKIEESREELKNINEKYDAYSKKLDELINNLNSGQKLEVARKIHYANKKIFIDSINQQTQLILINKISKHNTRTELKQPFQHSHSESKTINDNLRRTESKQIQNNKPKISLFKILTLILFLLWIGTLSLFFIDSENKISEIEPQENLLQNIEQPKVEQEPIKELNPIPNDTLTKKEYTIVAKKFTIDMPIKVIVQLIFDANPKDIKEHYANQNEEYAKKLFELNKNCFKGDTSNLFFSNDTLRHIPSYKKSK